MIVSNPSDPDPIQDTVRAELVEARPRLPALHACHGWTWGHEF